MLHFFSSAGDEGQAALAVVQASQKDCGVYRCVISNEYGTDSTDFLLSPEGEEPSAASHSFLGVDNCREGLVPGCMGKPWHILSHHLCEVLLPPCAD